MNRIGEFILGRRARHLPPTTFARPALRTITINATSMKPYKGFLSGTNEILKKKDEFWNCYLRGGPAATGIDIKVQAMFTNGWKLVGDDPNIIDAVEDRLDELDWENNAKMAVRDGYLMYWGIHEIAQTQDGGWRLVTRSSKDFMREDDEFGNTQRFIQKVMGSMGQFAPVKTIELPADKAIAIMPIPTADGQGVSLIERAWSQIEWHDKISQASADSIWRHGYPKWNIQLQDASGGQVPADVIAQMEGVTTDVNPRSEFVMNALSKIAEVDRGALTQVQDYGMWALQELAAALGIPESFFGLGQRSQQASSETAMKAFYDAVATDQFTIASQYQDQLIDNLIIPELAAEFPDTKAGDVALVFNNPNPDNDLKKAQSLKAITDINPMNPQWLLSQEEQLAYLGIHKTPVQVQQTQPVIAGTPGRPNPLVPGAIAPMTHSQKMIYEKTRRALR